jgi:malonate decarboxylase beta subunit
MSAPAQSASAIFINRASFIELDARARANALLDAGTGRELLGPFDRVESPWLEMQGVTPQEDDGCVVMKGKIAGRAAVVIALEGAFQGGSLGEVSGQKMTAALDLATADNDRGIPTSAVILLETGGVRLQEANLGLAAIAELIGSILILRKRVPVICLIAGTVGCYGGMGLAAGLASYVVMTREARLGLNGPEVIAQESGIEEFDPTDRALVWAIDGGEQRYETGFADVMVEDDTPTIAEAIRGLVLKGVPGVHRSEQVELYRNRIEALDPSYQWDPQEFRAQWNSKAATEEGR